MKLAHRMKRGYVAVCAALIAGVTIGVLADRVVVAQQDGIKRTILLRTDDPAGPAYEAVLGIAELAPGASSGKHRHHGIEIGYVLEGPVVFEHEGRSTVTLNAGDTFKNDGAHDARNVGPNSAKVLAIYLVEKGKPLAEPVR